MVKKTVLRLEMKGCDKCKKIALQSVAKIEGIDSLSINMEECTLTVIGEADPVFVAQTLRRKFRCVEIVSLGPIPSHRQKEGEKKEEKKAEGEKEEEKKAEPRKTPPKEKKIIGGSPSAEEKTVGTNERPKKAAT